MYIKKTQTEKKNDLKIWTLMWLKGHCSTIVLFLIHGSFRTLSQYTREVYFKQKIAKSIS